MIKYCPALIPPPTRPKAASALLIGTRHDFS